MFVLVAGCVCAFRIWPEVVRSETLPHSVAWLVMPGVGRMFDLHRYDIAFALAALFPIGGWALWNILSRRAWPSSGS